MWRVMWTEIPLQADITPFPKSQFSPLIIPRSSMPRALGGVRNNGMAREPLGPAR
jgi:hypothetical protein